MPGYIEGADRGQMTLFPDRLEDWIGEEKGCFQRRVTAAFKNNVLCSDS